MHLINFLYKVDGKSEVAITQENLSKLSLPDLLILMKAEQDEKIKVVVKNEE
jgi:hypothetical protein